MGAAVDDFGAHDTAVLELRRVLDREQAVVQALGERDRFHGLLVCVGGPAQAGDLRGHHRILAVVFAVLPLQI